MVTQAHESTTADLIFARCASRHQDNSQAHCVHHKVCCQVQLSTHPIIEEPAGTACCEVHMGGDETCIEVRRCSMKAHLQVCKGAERGAHACR